MPMLEPTTTKMRARHTMAETTPARIGIIFNEHNNRIELTKWKQRAAVLVCVARVPVAVQPCSQCPGDIAICIWKFTNDSYSSVPYEIIYETLFRCNFHAIGSPATIGMGDSHSTAGEQCIGDNGHNRVCVHSAQTPTHRENACPGDVRVERGRGGGKRISHRFSCVTLFIRHNMRAQFFRQMNYSFPETIYYIVSSLSDANSASTNTHTHTQTAHGLIEKSKRHEHWTDTEFM